MSKSSLSLLRGYCLFNEMKPYMKIFSLSSKAVQETIRMLDKKSNYRFPMIEGPVDNDSDNNKEKEATQNLNAQEAT